MITRFLAVLSIGLAPAFAETPPIVIGAVVSRSGAHAGPAEPYRRALELWQEQVNAQGGLLGRRVELRLLDDGSDAVQAGRLYAKLAADRADALIGPFGSAAALLANAEAETARRVIVNGAAPARAVQKRSGRFTFNAGPVNSGYGEGVIETVRRQGMKKVFLVARDDATSREMAEGAREAADRLGLVAQEIHLYRPGTSDFTLEVGKAEGADAWIAFGEVRDAADMVRTFRRVGYAPRLFFVRAAAHPDFIKLIGQDAEHTLASLEYDSRMPTRGNPEFVAAFRAKWSVAPAPAAAQGHAAASVLAEGIRRAGSVEPEKLRAALAASSSASVLPPVPAVVQIQKGRPEVVWPDALRTGAPLQPYPQWDERRVLKK